MPDKKPCPVDRGKLLIGLECHRHDDDKCSHCQYGDPADIKVPCGIALADDALAYIGWLEEKVEALEAAVPKGPYLMVCEEGDCMRGRTAVTMNIGYSHWRRYTWSWIATGG